MSATDPKVIEHTDSPAAATTVVDVVTAEPIEQAPTVDARTAGGLVAQAKVIEEQAKMISLATRTVLTHHLARLHAETGAKTIVIEVDGKKVATATIPESTDKTNVSAPTTFLEWVESHQEWSEEIVVTKSVRPAFEKRLLNEIEWVPFDPDEPDAELDPNDPWADVTERLPESRYVNGDVAMRAVHTPTGEFVPGLVFIPGQVDVSKFTLRFDAPKKGQAVTATNQRDGREIVADHLRAQGYEHFVLDLAKRGMLEIEA